MKYKILLKMLYSLVVAKRLFWWIGKKINNNTSKLIINIWKFFAFWSYKIEYITRHLKWTKGKKWILKRGGLQLMLLIIFFVLAIPQTNLFSKEIITHPGKNTKAYQLFGPGGEDYDIEEITASTKIEYIETEILAWKSGAVSSKLSTTEQSNNIVGTELGMIALGGSAVVKPSIMPGAEVLSQERRSVVKYIIQPGDSLSSIAYHFGLSVSTLMWENGLSSRSIIRPGQTIQVPPVSGIMHTIKKGDNLSKIASVYNVEAIKIVEFNNLKEDGTDLIIGEKIMIPDGFKKQVITIVSRPSYTTKPTYSNVKTPASSVQSPGLSGFVWPSSAHIITQYYGWRHHGLDVAGPKNSAIYASKAGIITKSQCGWNSGYGCYIIIDHGGGVTTLYGHNNKLLVSAGDRVKTGQTISLMGNTGKVRGPTGIHLHFEVRVNGARKNPLKYVR